jgi:hypothetical protein
MYVNAKIIPVETIPGMGEQLKESSRRVNSSGIFDTLQDFL